MDKKEAIANAEAMGMELSEYLSFYNISLEEGKLNGSTETPPTEPVKSTAAGDSSLADISLESPELTPIDKALSRLGKIDISAEFESLVENIDTPESIPVMRELPNGIMSPTGEFFEKYAYEDYIKSAEEQLGEGAEVNKVTDLAKSMYLDQAKSDIINSEAETILEDFDNEIYTPLGRLRKYMSFAMSGADMSEGGEQRRKLEEEVSKSKERAFSQIDKLSNDKAAQATYLNAAATELNQITAKYKDDPTSLSEEEVTTYKNTIASYDNVLKTYDSTNEELANYIEKGQTLNELVDLTGRSYDNLDVAGGRVASATLNFAGNFLNYAKEMTPEMIRARITGEEANGYVPMYSLTGINTAGIDLLDFAGDKLVAKADEITGGIKKRQELSKVSSVEDFLEFGLDLFSEQAVNTALTASMPVAGLGLVSASAAGDKFRSMELEMQDGEKITPLQFYTVGTLFGAGEYVTEKVALNQFLGAKKAIKKSFDLSDISITQSPTTTISALGTWGTGLNQEGLAEAGSQFIGNFGDKFILDKSVSMWDGVSEAYFSGAVMSGLGFGAPGLISGVYSAAVSGNEAAQAGQRSARVIEITNRINDLQSNNDLSDVSTQQAVNLLQEEADGLIKENLQSMRIAEARVDELSRPDKRVLLNIDSEIWKSKGEVDKINSNNKLTEDEKKTLISKYAKNISDLNSGKDRVLANSQFSQARNKANLLQREIAGIKGLDFKIVNAKNPEDAINQATDLINNSNLEEENKKGLLAQLDEYKNKENKEAINGFEFGAKFGLPIVIGIEDVALSNLSGSGRSVLLHETSHATLFKKLLEGDADILGLSSDLESYMTKRFAGAQKAIDEVNKKYPLSEFSKETIAEEKMVALLEYGSTTNVQMDRTIQGKLLDRWNNIFPNKEITSIETGQDVWNALKAFNASFDEGKISGLTENILKGEVKARQKDAKEKLKEVRKKPDTNFSLDEDVEFKSPNKADLFTVTVNVFNEATSLYGIDIKLNEDGTPAFTKAEWDNIDDNTKLGLGFMLGETWKPYVKYLMGSRRDVPGFDEYANQIVDRTSTGVEKGDDGIPFLVKTYNPEAGAKLSSYIFGQIGRRLQGAINKQDGFGEITVDAVSDKPGAKELVQEETTAVVDDAPKYKNLIRRGVVNPIAVGNIKSKIKPIIRVLKTPMTAPVSKNVTVKPWVNELRLQLGKQVDLIIKQEMGGVKGGELRRFLLKNKTAILENMTTSYLTKAMPFAVQKSVGGVYTSNWQGQKIDRETTSTQKAGRTSGNELVRRLPKASIRISDAEFLAAVIGPGGNPIRGRKEALAKAIAEELSLDIITQELKDPNSEISEALKQNQEMLGAEANDNIAIEAARDFERGTIKYSIKPTTSKEVSDVSLSNSNIPKSQETNAQREKHEEELFDWTGKNLGRILKQYTGRELFTLNTKEGQIEFLKAFEELGRILPKRFFRKGNSGMGSLTKTVKNLGAVIKTDSPLHKHWKKEVQITFKRMSKTGFAKPIPGVTWTITPWRKLASTTSDFIKNKSKIESLNKTNARHHKIMFTEFYELIKANPNNSLIPAAIAQYLQLATNDSTHYHRIGFALVGVEEGFIAGKNKGTFEHALNSHSTSIVLFEAMMLAADPNSKIDFNQAYESIMMQAKVIGLTDATDKKLVGPFKDGMGPNFTLEKGWPVRYEDAGIAIDKILLISGQNLAQARMTPDGLKFSLSLKPDAAENQEKFREEDIKNNTIDYSVSEVNDLNSGINQMIERATGVSAEQTFADIDARIKGKNIGKYKFFAPGADDFRGLTSYTFAGKGKQGEADQKFFEDNLVKPYQRGINNITRSKQTVKNDFAFVVKSFPKQAKMMAEKVPGTEYTYDQALRVYLWQRQGMEVPGIKPETVRNLSRAISENLGLIEFANATLLASKQGEWMAPSKFWATETVLSGLYNMTENLGRKVYLAEFIENADIIFSPENLNKMEALYGSKYRSALEDSLYRMKNGTNRNSGSDATTNRWNNWVNQSTGAIMFFNRRSAVLQTLSIANFTNWSDNNPVKQAMAFANQKQYWSDFAMIFNSPKLKERRSGLKNDVNASEIANAAKGETNKAAAVLNQLLELGFKPTQIADSFAIASGGAAFYRNRVNTYLKQGKPQKEAEKLAFEEFSSNADESQQSSDPMLVAQQQASVLGRLILAFQNTPMQYTRLMKKAGQDIINSRGDFKTNMSKILYYGAVQNLIFSTLQSALFAFIPGFMDDEDDDKRDQKLETKQTRILNSMIDSLLKGSGLTGAVLATVKNSVLELNKQMDKGFLGDPMYVALQVLGISPPIGSKMRKLYGAYQTYRFEKDARKRGASIVANGRLNFSPWYSIVGNVAAGTLNIPGDRIIDEITSISEALDSRNTQWQRLALAMGWKTWDVGAKNEEHDLLKVIGKEQRKIEGKAKAKATREANKKKSNTDKLTWAQEQEDRLMNPGKYE